MADFNPYLPPAAPLDATAGSATAQTLNPWLSMWTRPRATIQQIIEENPERLVLLLAAIGGISEVLDRASVKSLGDKMELTMIFVMAALAGPVIGISGLYIGGALLHWTGGWIGGKAPAVNIRAAMAWSNVLLIWALLLWIPSVALFGSEVFATETPRIDANPSLAYVLIGLAAIELVIGMWAFVAFLKCLGQVQGFSAWKALGNTALAGLVVGVPIAVLAYVFYATTLV